MPGIDTLMDKYIRTGSFQKNILLCHSGHTQGSETNSTYFGSLNTGLLELVMKEGVTAI